MWGWLVGLFSSRYEPLERPAPLSAACRSSLDGPDLKRVRDIQHDADNVITGARGRRYVTRHPDLFTEHMRDAWQGEKPQ